MAQYNHGGPIGLPHGALGSARCHRVAKGGTSAGRGAVWPESQAQIEALTHS